MLERHQIFVVARVCVRPGERRVYRCIAAVEHDCYSESDIFKLPLYGVNFFKRLVRVPANAALVEEELATYYQREASRTACPCPYTSFLVETACNIQLVRLGGPYLIRTARRRGSVNMGWTGGENDAVITVLDVTTPRDPSYCFVWLHDTTLGPGPQLAIRTPLRAAEYLRSYIPAPSTQLDIGDSEGRKWREMLNLQAIANLDDMPLIPRKTLGLVWPRQYGRRFQDKGLSSPNSPSNLDALREQVSLSPEDVALLAKATREDLGDVVDLSRFPLAPSQLFSILGELGRFQRLDISYNQEVNKEVFINILKRFQDISWINVMHCPISQADLVELAGTEPRIFRSIGAIIHPTFFRPTEAHSYDEREDPPFKIDFPTAFRLCIINERSSFFQFIYLPFFRTDELVQNLIELVELMQDVTILPGNVPPSILASASALRTEPEQGWEDRHIQLVPHSSEEEWYEPLEGGYEFFVQERFPEGLRYGVFPPIPPGKTERTESDMMEMEEFLERLREEGATPPGEEVAARRLVELCSKMKKLPMESLKSRPKLKKWYM